MNTETMNLKDYLRENMTAHDYFALPDTLGISETKLSRLLNGTDSWTIEPFKKLVIELNYPPLQLIAAYKIKNDISYNDMQELIEVIK